MVLASCVMAPLVALESLLRYLQIPPEAVIANIARQMLKQ